MPLQEPRLQSYNGEDLADPMGLLIHCYSLDFLGFYLQRVLFPVCLVLQVEPHLSVQQIQCYLNWPLLILGLRLTHWASHYPELLVAQASDQWLA